MDPLGRMMSLPRLRPVAAAHGRGRRLCDGRLVVEHEGGYSAELVPFCGVAIVEAMSGITTECTGTILHEFPAHLGGQELQPHQAAVLDAVAPLVDRIGAVPA